MQQRGITPRSFPEAANTPAVRRKPDYATPVQACSRKVERMRAIA
jgi:hypothetical protein